MQEDVLNTEIILKNFSGIDCGLVRSMTRLEGGQDAVVLLSAALVSQAAGEGHACIDLTQMAGQPFGRLELPGPNPACPSLAVWRRHLQNSPLVGTPAQWRPLILDRGHFLYLQRFHYYEQMIARCLRPLSQQKPSPLPLEKLSVRLPHYFHEDRSDETDWQKIAAIIAMMRRLCIISGPPGTGKTTTAAKIIGLLIDVHAPQSLRFALCAPTGKAAARLGEALSSAATAFYGLSAVRNRFPMEASTIHRLLGYRNRRFIFNQNNPLPADVVVVDEASMIDLALMAHLMAAVPPEARLIILGDHHQLSSVEAGAVLGDICQGTTPGLQTADLQAVCRQLRLKPPPDGHTNNRLRVSPLSDNVAILARNYRFSGDKGIGPLIEAVKRGDGQLARKLFTISGAELNWLHPPLNPIDRQGLQQAIVEGYRPVFEARSPDQALEALNGFMVLGALIGGPWGTERLNQWIEALLRQAGLISVQGIWYPGRPLMIRQNDYHTGLFNGDVGVVWPHLTHGKREPRVWFRLPSGERRAFAPAQLPEHQTAMAITVHKSQGSEYRSILMALPDQDSPVLCRELVYTGLSRARQQIMLVASEHIFDLAVKRRVARTSGLIAALESSTLEAACDAKQLGVKGWSAC